MKIKALLMASLLISAVSCSKDEPIGDNTDPFDDWGSMFPGYNPGPTKTSTPKGMVDSELVKREDLPAWLQSKTTETYNGYIMRAGSGSEVLYFVYDKIAEYGRHYDAQGNPSRDNPKLKDWVIIYKWQPSYPDFPTQYF